MSLTLPVPPRDTSPPSSLEAASPHSIIEPDVGPDRTPATSVNNTANTAIARSRTPRMACRAATRPPPVPLLPLTTLTVARSTKSVNQSIFDYVRENGRTYHRYQAGCEYPFHSPRPAPTATDPVQRIRFPTTRYRARPRSYAAAAPR
jgi:hypothetical protein